MMADHFEQKQIENEPVVIHQGIKCDGCQMDPILGVRYKCALCPNFELCCLCESKNIHDHPMLKIRKAEKELVSVSLDYQKNMNNSVA
jgi:hypothetical protein